MLGGVQIHYQRHHNKGAAVMCRYLLLIVEEVTLRTALARGISMQI